MSDALNVGDALKRTPVYDEHVRLGAKLVPFAGWEMPVQYPAGITAEHRAVRQAAGIFDVSHMGELVVRGPEAEALLQYVTVNDVSALQTGQAQYTAICLESGGILDDCLVYRYPDRYVVVVNASNTDAVRAWVIRHAAAFDAEVEDVSAETGLIALQGPEARRILRPLGGEPVDELRYYRFAEGEVAGVPATIACTGYTGEDGFELYLPAERTAEVWRALLEAGEGTVAPAGLGARDSLRLEMGYALYGHELDAEHTPLEAGLAWITKLDKGDFIGRDALLAQKQAGVARRLVGLLVSGRGFPRAGYAILYDGETVGAVTSGTVSPTLGTGIAMGYVPAELARPGTELAIDVRGKPVSAVVTRPPFHTGGSIRRA